MTISKNISGTELTVALEGRLDTATAPLLEKELVINDITKLILEFKELKYISSAGLRILLSAQKKMTAQNGSMVIKNPNEMVMEVFEVTGFTDIVTIEND